MSNKRDKKRLLLRIGILLVELVIAGTLYVLIDGKKKQQSERLDWLVNDIQKSKSNLSRLKSRAKEYSEAIVIWDNTPEHKRSLVGIRINPAKELLEELSDTYRFSKTNITFSKPAQEDSDLDRPTVAIISSDISMTFNAITDEQVFRFIETLDKRSPGMIQLKSISLNLDGEITKDLLEAIAAGERPELVRGSINMVWRNLKYTGPAKSNLNSSGGR